MLIFRFEKFAIGENMILSFVILIISEVINRKFSTGICALN